MKKYQIAILAVCVASALLSLIDDKPAGYIASAAIAIVLAVVWRKKPAARVQTNPPQEAPTAVPPQADTPPAPAGQVYTVVDLETPNQNNDRICSISITSVCGAEARGTKSFMVNPETAFASFNSSLTGITAEMVQNAPTFPQVWPSIKPALQEGLFVAHSAVFDLSVLFKCLRAYNLDFPSIRYIDTVELAKAALPVLGHYGLDNICQSLGIRLDHHRAESDSQACAAILIYCLRKGIDVEPYIHAYDPSCLLSSESDRSCGSSDGTGHPRNLSKNTQQMNRLLDIVEAVCQDGQVTEDEVSLLRKWIDEHPELSKEFPYAMIHASIEEALQDDVLEPQELQQLFKGFLFLLDPLSYSFPCDDVDLTGKLICLSGNFDYGTKEERKESQEE